MNVIHTKNLTKIYRRFEKEPGLTGSVKSLFRRRFTEKAALAGFDLEIAEGEAVGLVGPNGAGKTTLVKLLSGIIAPSAGEVSVLGFYPNRLENAFKRQYALVMGQKSQLFFELTPLDTFSLFKELYGIPGADYRRRLDYFIGLFGVEEFLNAQVRTLSLGERMKMELITALLHGPRLLFLDEPTIGLDVVVKQAIRALLRRWNRERGTTVFLTSHDPSDIEQLCRRAVVIDRGRVGLDAPVEELRSNYLRTRRIQARFDAPRALPDSHGVKAHVAADGLTAVLDVDTAARNAGEVAAALLAGGGVLDITVSEPTMEDVIAEIFKGQGGDTMQCDDAPHGGEG